MIAGSLPDECRPRKKFIPTAVALVDTSTPATLRLLNPPAPYAVTPRLRLAKYSANLVHGRAYSRIHVIPD